MKNLNLCHVTLFLFLLFSLTLPLQAQGGGRGPHNGYGGGKHPVRPTHPVHPNGGGCGKPDCQNCNPRQPQRDNFTTGAYKGPTGSQSRQKHHRKHGANFVPPKQNKGSQFDDSVGRDMGKVKLRDHKEIEKAATKYVMMYDAYTAAKYSKNPKIKKKTKEYLKKYRMAYAEFLRLLKEDNIYDPKLPKNHAGIYNKKHKEVKNEERDWNDVGLANMSKNVKSAVEQDKDVADVQMLIQSQSENFPGSTAPSEFYFLDSYPYSMDDARDPLGSTEASDDMDVGYGTSEVGGSGN